LNELVNARGITGMASNALRRAIGRRWKNPNRLAAAQAGTQLMHQGMVNVLAPRPTVPTEQQGALEHAANQQHARAQMGLGPDLGGTVTPQMRLQAESMDPSLMAMKGGKLAAALAGATGWHGGPTKWAPEPGFPKGRPSLKYIGTGEGAQAYGHGFYSAEAKGVGQSYKAETAFKHGKRDIAEMLYSQKMGDVDAAVKSLKGEAAAYDAKGWPTPEYRVQYDEALAKLESFRMNPPDAGVLYKLDIPDEDVAKFLDWDAPLSEQSEFVKAELKDLLRLHKVPRKNNVGAETTGGQLYEYLERNIFGDSQQVAEELRSIGIPGNKYYDQMSRGEGKGTRNYVIWDQDVLDRTKMLKDE
jgi:hypothetical protein